MRSKMYGTSFPHHFQTQKSEKSKERLKVFVRAPHQRKKCRLWKKTNAFSRKRNVKILTEKMNEIPTENK